MITHTSGMIKMKGSLVNLIPDGFQIEQSDIGHLFYKYVKQNEFKDCHQILKEWIDVIEDVFAEEFEFITIEVKSKYATIDTRTEK